MFPRNSPAYEQRHAIVIANDSIDSAAHCHFEPSRVGDLASFPILNWGQHRKHPLKVEREGSFEQSCQSRRPGLQREHHELRAVPQCESPWRGEIGTSEFHSERSVAAFLAGRYSLGQ